MLKWSTGYVVPSQKTRNVRLSPAYNGQSPPYTHPYHAHVGNHDEIQHYTRLGGRRTYPSSPRCVTKCTVLCLPRDAGSTRSWNTTKSSLTFTKWMLKPRTRSTCAVHVKRDRVTRKHGKRGCNSTHQVMLVAQHIARDGRCENKNDNNGETTGGNKFPGSLVLRM